MSKNKSTISNRVSLRFNVEKEKHLRALVLLKQLGRKQSAFISEAINYYVENSPEFEDARKQGEDEFTELAVETILGEKPVMVTQVVREDPGFKPTVRKTKTNNQNKNQNKPKKDKSKTVKPKEAPRKPVKAEYTPPVRKTPETTGANDHFGTLFSSIASMVEDDE